MRLTIIILFFCAVQISAQGQAKSQLDLTGTWEGVRDGDYETIKLKLFDDDTYVVIKQTTGEITPFLEKILRRISYYEVTEDSTGNIINLFIAKKESPIKKRVMIIGYEVVSKDKLSIKYINYLDQEYIAEFTREAYYFEKIK